jgi:YggT family protein
MVNFNIDSHLDIVVVWLLSLLVDFLFFCKWAIIASIILSWVRVFNQSPSVFLGAVMEVVMQMTEPLLAPFRRIMPDLGPIDLSPMVAFLAIIICQHLLGAAAVTLLAMV